MHKPVTSSSAPAWTLKAQLESGILALALWLPRNASYTTFFTAGKLHFPPLRIAKAVTEIFLNEEKPIPIPEKQLQGLVMWGLFWEFPKRTFLSITNKDFPNILTEDSSKCVPSSSEGLEQFGPAGSLLFLLCLFQDAATQQLKDYVSLQQVRIFRVTLMLPTTSNTTRKQKFKSSSSSPLGSNCCHLFPYKGYLNTKAGNHLFADHFATG